MIIIVDKRDKIHLTTLDPKLSFKFDLDNRC